MKRVGPFLINYNHVAYQGDNDAVPPIAPSEFFLHNELPDIDTDIFTEKVMLGSLAEMASRIEGPTSYREHLRKLGVVRNVEGPLRGLTMVSFKYNKPTQDGATEREAKERAIISLGVLAYGVHQGHPNEPQSHYIAGIQIGTYDPAEGVVFDPAEVAKGVKFFSINSMVDGPCDPPVIAGGGGKRGLLQ